MYNRNNTYSTSEFIRDMRYKNYEEISRIEAYDWLRDFVINSSNIFINKNITDLIFPIPNAEKEKIISEAKDKIRRKANIFAVKNTNMLYNTFFNNYNIESFSIHLYLIKDENFDYVFKAEVNSVIFKEKERWGDNHRPHTEILNTNININS